MINLLHKGVIYPEKFTTTNDPNVLIYKGKIISLKKALKICKKNCKKK